MKLVVKISDGLGNQIFQYAFARSLECKYKGKVYLDVSDINNTRGKNKSELMEQRKYGHRDYTLDKFRIVLPVAKTKTVSKWDYIYKNSIDSEIIRQASSIGLYPWRCIEEQDLYNNPKVCPLFSSYYKGYWFDLKYYSGIRSILQNEFHLKRKLKLPRDIKYLLDNRIVNAVHVRRGDFLKIGRNISEKDYYEKAISYMNRRVPDNSVYFIFSDDILWVKSNMRFPGNPIFISEMGFSDFEEFAIMRACSNFIIANSTFSYWPAYLHDGGIVVSPKKWRTKITPDGWVCL